MLPFSLLALCFISTVLSSSLRTRDFNCRQTSIDDKGFIYYSPSWPTCANDYYLTDHFGTPKSVTVQPDCDNAIASACNAVDLMFNVSRNLYPIKSVSGTCEVDILFSQQHASQISDYDRSSCTTTLQSITETCMLTGTGKYAAPGQQAGIVNLLCDSMALSRNAGNRFAANTGCNDQPAYLVGSPGYFKSPNQYSGAMTGVGKDIGGVGAGSITRDCLLSDSCA